MNQPSSVQAELIASVHSVPPHILSYAARYQVNFIEAHGSIYVLYSSYCGRTTKATVQSYGNNQVKQLGNWSRAQGVPNGAMELVG